MLVYATLPLALLLLAQLLLYGPLLQRLLNRWLAPSFSIGFGGVGFILPLLSFRARNFRMMIQPTLQSDRVYFECQGLRFRISLLHLFFFHLRIVGLRLDRARLEYVNRVDSHQKNRFLPGRHRVEIRGGDVRNGLIIVRDETRTPVYRMELRDLQLHDLNMDVATPVDLLFRTGRGSAQIGSGLIEIGQTRSGGGFIRLNGVTWGEISSMDGLPFTGWRIALFAHHEGDARGRRAEGALSFISPDPARATEGVRPGADAVHFEFPLHWEDYAISMDLGLQRLIGEVLRHGRAPWVSRGLLLGSRSVFEIVKKQER
ncbi:MAG: hypothetical protein K1X75_07105 [Leptospirales bacterium]|nr:hypothetical protein [Leptospirales bacterium]